MEFLVIHSYRVCTDQDHYMNRINLSAKDSIFNQKHTSQNANPMNEQMFNIIFTQEHGLFYDLNEFYLEFHAQMFYEDNAWSPTETGGGPTLGEQKGISMVNNVAPSSIRDLTVYINNQVLSKARLCEIDYFETILNTSRADYDNGILLEKGFYKETAGFVAEWDCGVDKNDNTAPKNNNNRTRAKLCDLFFMGKMQHFK